MRICPTICVCVCFCLIQGSALAAPVSSLGPGNWETPDTWSGSAEPGADDDVTIVSGHTVTITAAEQKSIKSLTVAGTLTHSSNGTSDQSLRVDVNVTDDISINSGGKIDVSGKGYSGGSGRAGYGPAAGGFAGDDRTSGGGGGGGGEGGDSSLGELGLISAGGTCYGSISQPTAIGSGGGGTMNVAKLGGSGGGGVKLTAVGTITITGSIMADGTDGEQDGGFQGRRAGGGGGGGSIWITAGTFAGAGTLSAVGGDTGSDQYAAGGGGAGRIAVSCTTKTFSGVLQAWGGSGNSWDRDGEDGGAGTEYVKVGSSAMLTVDNNATSVNGTLGTWGSNADLATCSTIEILKCGRLKHAAGSGAGLTFTIPFLTIDGYSAIDVTGCGYAGATGSYATKGSGTGGGYSGYWNSGSPPRIGAGGGAGYGGLGGDADPANPPDRGAGGPGGTTYGSKEEPTHLGSGGGGTGASGSVPNKYGARGGGIVKLVINTLTLDGSIISDGGVGDIKAGFQMRYATGGGSGGSVWVDATRLLGTGWLLARGGASGNGGHDGGGGGGGRIALYYSGEYDTNNISVLGGWGYQTGGAGSVYIEYTGQRGTCFFFK